MGFDDHGYPRWNDARIDHLTSEYGEDFFKGKTVLELGCGYAGIGTRLSDMGAKVTVSDAREEHIAIVKERYHKLTALVVDSEDTEWKYPENEYDIIIHYGLLYHLSNPDENIRMISKRCKYLFLETEVLDSSDPEYILYKKENKSSFGMSYSGDACTPSWAYVERLLDENNFEWQRVKPRKSDWHCYDWHRTGEDPSFKSGQRAMWYCKRKEE
tara:strand:+ start:1260 stop:1901 length:642 start_codon:yes stop_codon:yes gene_type:complete